MGCQSADGPIPRTGRRRRGLLPGPRWRRRQSDGQPAWWRASRGPWRTAWGFTDEADEWAEGFRPL